MDTEVDIRENPPFQQYIPSWYADGQEYIPSWAGIAAEKYYVIWKGKLVESPKGQGLDTSEEGAIIG